MGRLQDFDEDSVTCDRVGCGKHERVPSGQIPDRWLRGALVDAPGKDYNACSGNCAVLINGQVAVDQKAEYRMTWWSSKGEVAETFLGPNGVLGSIVTWSIKRKQ